LIPENWHSLCWNSSKFSALGTRHHRFAHAKSATGWLQCLLRNLSNIRTIVLCFLYWQLKIQYEWDGGGDCKKILDQGGGALSPNFPVRPNPATVQTRSAPPRFRSTRPMLFFPNTSIFDLSAAASLIRGEVIACDVPLEGSLTLELYYNINREIPYFTSRRFICLTGTGSHLVFCNHEDSFLCWRTRLM
jgi:hypothetical protein